MERKLNITGNAKISAKPDIVILSFTIFGHEWEYNKSLNTLDEKVSTLSNLIVKNELKKTDLKTKAFNVKREISYDKELKKHKFNGYKATHKMELTLPIDKELLNSILNDIGKSSSNIDFEIGFGVKDSAQYEKELIKLAIEHGTESARVICESSGVELKEIINIDYSFADFYIRSKMGWMSNSETDDFSAMTIELEPDTIDINDNIKITWRID